MNTSINYTRSNRNEIANSEDDDDDVILFDAQNVVDEIQCICNDDTFSTVKELLQHVNNNHKIDIVNEFLSKSPRIDIYCWSIFINYLRNNSIDVDKLTNAICILNKGSGIWKIIDFVKPKLANDRLITGFYDIFEDCDKEDFSYYHHITAEDTNIIVKPELYELAKTDINNTTSSD